jgi:hypothetical protein
VLKLPTRSIALASVVYLLMVSTGVAAIASLHDRGNAVYAKVKATSASFGPHALKVVTVPKVVVCDKFSAFRNAAHLTNEELITLLRNVGFSGHQLKVAWAVVMKESRGRPLAHNTNRHTGDNSYGLFQVNMIDSLGADRRAKLGLKSNAVLLDPVTNVKAAYHMTKGGKDWSAWTSSNYKALTVAKWVRAYPNPHAAIQ